MPQFAHRNLVARAMEQLAAPGTCVILERTLDQKTLDTIEAALVRPATDEELAEAVDTARMLLERTGRNDDVAAALAALATARPRPTPGPPATPGQGGGRGA